MPIVVQKYGGSSLASAELITKHPHLLGALLRSAGVPDTSRRSRSAHTRSVTWLGGESMRVRRSNTGRDFGQAYARERSLHQGRSSHPVLILAVVMTRVCASLGRTSIILWYRICATLLSDLRQVLASAPNCWANLGASVR